MKRRPVLPPWSRAECALCADPVEIVHLDYDPTKDDGRRVEVIRAIDYRHGTIAARNIAGTLHGYAVTKFRPVKDGFVPLRLHADVCTEAVPPTEQRQLFDI
jgi:hypothetical protein